MIGRWFDKEGPLQFIAALFLWLMLGGGWLILLFVLGVR